MRRTWLIVLVLFLAALLIYAYIDGGREEPHLIEQQIEVDAGR